MARKPDPSKRRKPNAAQKAWGGQPFTAQDPPPDQADEADEAEKKTRSQVGTYKCCCWPRPGDERPCTPTTCQRCDCPSGTHTDKAGRCKTCGRCRACGLAGRPFYTADDVRWIEHGEQEAS